MNIEPIIFEFEGRMLEVRAFRGGDMVKVAVFEGDRKVTPNCYNVPYETVAATRTKKFSIDPVLNLMETYKIQVQKGLVNLN